MIFFLRRAAGVDCVWAHVLQEVPSHLCLSQWPMSNLQEEDCSHGQRLNARQSSRISSLLPEEDGSDPNSVGGIRARRGRKKMMNR